MWRVNRHLGMLRRGRFGAGIKAIPLEPKHRITFNLCVSFHEETVIPGILGAFEGALFVVKSKVSNDLRARWIGGANIVVAVDESMRLIEVDGLCHIGGDHVSSLPSSRRYPLEA